MQPILYLLQGTDKVTQDRTHHSTPLVGREQCQNSVMASRQGHVHMDRRMHRLPTTAVSTGLLLPD